MAISMAVEPAGRAIVVRTVSVAVSMTETSADAPLTT
jgi:hypothetical protein